MRPSLVCCLVASIVLSSCWRTASDEVLDAFVAVNDSLGRTKARLEHDRADLPPIPFADLGCPELQERSDSLALALREVERARKPILQDLAGVPQDDLEAGIRSFTKDGQGEALFTAIAGAYAFASRLVPDADLRMEVADLRARSFPHDSFDAWPEADIKGAPRAAVVAILSKLQLEMEHLSRQCDAALLKACAEKQ